MLNIRVILNKDMTIDNAQKYGSHTLVKTKYNTSSHWKLEAGELKH
jgi:hypothetical protein